MGKILICIITLLVYCVPTDYDLYECVYRIRTGGEEPYQVTSKEARRCYPWTRSEGLITITNDVSREKVFSCSNCSVELIGSEVIAKAGEWKQAN